MFKIPSRRILIPYIKLLATPTAVIVTVLFLSLLLFNNGISRIKRLMSELSEEQKKQKVLQDKLTVLKQVLPGVLDKTDITVIALPDKNPASWVLSQIKKEAEEDNISISKTTFEKVNEENEIKTMEISFELDAKDYRDLLNFYSELARIAPLVAISEVTIKKGTDQTTVLSEGKLSIFWSPIPETLPPVEEPLSQLSTAEIETLNTAFGLRPPAFSELVPVGPTSRETPFN